MSHFKVVNKKNEDGTYTLSYGKGSKKLTDIMMKDESGWFAKEDNTASSFATMKECKEMWGCRAEAEYHMDEDDTPAAPPPPPAPKSVGRADRDGSSSPPAPPAPPAKKFKAPESPLSKTPALQEGTLHPPAERNGDYWLKQVMQWHDRSRASGKWKVQEFSSIMVDVRAHLEGKD